MQQACQTLADTGANIAPYIAIAFGLLALSALTFYFLHSGRRLNKGFFSLLIVFMMAGSFILVPTKSLAATPDCTPAGQTAGAGATTPTPTPAPPLTCPTGFVVVPGNPAYSTTDFCVMKYTAKNSGGTVASSNDINGDGSFLSNTYTGGTAVSTATDQPWTNISQTDAITASQTAGTGAHLLTENEWMTIAHNILLQPANWCDADGSNCGNAPGTAGKVLASGHNDNTPNFPLESSANDTEACYGTVTAGVNTVCGADPSTQKRTLTLSNGSGLWDLVGNVGHWTSGAETQGDLPSFGGNGGPLEYNFDSGFGLDVPDNWGTLNYTNPAVHNPGAASWGVAQGVGLLVSGFSSGSPAVVAFFRGGTWGVGPDSGAFTLDMVATPSDSHPGIGFRAAL